MFNFRPTYQPLITFCKELIAEKKVLMEENEELKAELKQNRFSLKHTEDVNSLLRETVKTVNMKRAELEERVADLEEQLAKKVFLLDDEGAPIKSFTLTGKLVLMEESKENTEEKLKVGKWYHTTDFTKEELEALLPVGTEIVVEQKTYYEGINEEPPKTTEYCAVGEVVKGKPKQQTYIKVKDGHPYKEWFKIIEE